MTLPFAVVANKESRALKRRLNVAFGVRADGRLGVQGRAGSRGARPPASTSGRPPNYPPMPLGSVYQHLQYVCCDTNKLFVVIPTNCKHFLIVPMLLGSVRSRMVGGDAGTCPRAHTHVRLVWIKCARECIGDLRATAKRLGVDCGQVGDPVAVGAGRQQWPRPPEWAPAAGKGAGRQQWRLPHFHGAVTRAGPGHRVPT